MRELIRAVTGCLRTAEIRLMALPAVHVGEVVVPVRVAVYTLP